VTLAKDLKDLRCEPADPELYAEAKRRVKARVRRWPSAYASAQLVQEYRRAGGEYGPGCGRGGLGQWFAERWVDVCEPDLPPCGRDTSSVETEREYRRAYPKCRPEREARAMTDTERAAACRRKRRAVAGAGPRVVRVK